MKLDYSIGEGGWAGIERTFATPQDWSLYQRISFGFYGMSSGATIRFEILDNRASESNSDTAERFEYKFSDNFTGWKTFDLPWSAFVPHSDWQPNGAPNNGFSRISMGGLNFSPVNGQGTFQVDEIKLIKD